MRARSIGVALLLFLALGASPGCGGADLGECPPDSSDRRIEGALALEQSCTACHSKTKTGTARGGAPDDINLDDTNYVWSEPSEIYEVISEGVMPPSGKLPDETIESIRVYLACIPSE